MLKLKLQYFGHLMRRTDSFEKTLILEMIEGGGRRGQQDEMASPTQWMSLSKLWETVKDREGWITLSAVHQVAGLDTI